MNRGLNFAPRAIFGVVGFLGLLSCIIGFMVTPPAAQAQQAEGFTSVQVTQGVNKFDVMTMVTNGGNVTGIQVFPDYGSILVTVQLGSADEEESRLKIILPRELIDAKNSTRDSNFTVVVEGESTQYNETRTTDTEREIDIVLPSDTTQVEIFGNHIIPEFPSGFLAVTVTFVAITTAFILYRTKRSSTKYRGFF